MGKKKANNVGDINIYDMYMKDIHRYDAIDDAKTRENLKIYKNGDDKDKKIAKEQIVGSHQRLVRSLTNKFLHYDNFMDIISEANIGLMEAIEKFDMNSDTKFTTYATYWVRKYIFKYLTTIEPMVKPNNAIKLGTYVPTIREEFWNNEERYPTTEELQSLLMSKHNLNFANKEDLMPYRTVSTDEKYGEDEDGQEFMETTAYTSKTATCNTDMFMGENDRKIVVDKMLSIIGERDAYIMKCFYGIGMMRKSIDDIASDVGLSYERVRQIANGIVKKLGKTCKDLVEAC